MLYLLLALATAIPAFAQGPASAPAAAVTPAAKAPAPAASASGRPVVRQGDYIVAVVNEESVTANEVADRIRRLHDDLQSKGGAMPTAAELRKMALDQLVEERVIVTYARD